MENITKYLNWKLTFIVSAFILVLPFTAPNTLAANYPNTIYPNTVYQSGTLILDGNTVYNIYKGQKIPFSSSAVFSGLGYKWTNLYGSNIDYIPQASYTTNSIYDHHPYGSWVIWGQTVYFIDEYGLIPITTHDIFLNNGGQDKLLIPMSWYDSQLYHQSFMTYNDPRLQNQSNNQSLSVTMGNNFYIDLESNPSTGYQWEANYDRTYLQLINKNFVPYTNSLGSAGTEIFQFKPLQRGQTSITFSYRRSWEVGPPLKEQVYQINIY